MKWITFAFVFILIAVNAQAYEELVKSPQLKKAETLLKNGEYHEGISMIKRQAEDGDPVAQLTLARLLQYGVKNRNGKEMIPPDKVQALKWTSISINHFKKNQKGMVMLQAMLLRQKMTPDEILAYRRLMIDYCKETGRGGEEAIMCEAFLSGNQ